VRREGREERKREDLQAKCADRTICFHVIYQETRLCGRNPRERVNHVHLVVVCCVIFRLLYCYYIVEVDLRYNLRSRFKCGKE
jgi:hypothetical protein